MTTHDLLMTVHRDAVGIMETAKKEGARETVRRTSILIDELENLSTEVAAHE